MTFKSVFILKHLYLAPSRSQISIDNLKKSMFILVFRYCHLAAKRILIAKIIEDKWGAENESLVLSWQFVSLQRPAIEIP